jgi:uncharacterized protein
MAKQENDQFIGRKNELKKLKFYLKQELASLIVVTGRRRIGKSRLIEEFSNNMKLIRFSGIFPEPGVTAQTQRDEFARRLSANFNLPPLKSDDWAELLETLAQQTQSSKVIILLDELSWMAMDDVTFLPKLKTTWDEAFKHNPKLILVLCSSISSWIEKNVLSTTGYVGRVTYTLHLDELPLKDCNAFWGKKKISAYEKFKIMSITGGIPLYLENIDYSNSAEENIHRLCFTKGGLLVREFANIFNDYFSAKSAVYKKILGALVKKAHTASEVCELLAVPNTGLMSEYFHDLEQAGFITRDFSWNLTTGLDKKISQYRLSDNYTRFYLKYIEPLLSRINRNSYEFISLGSLENWQTIMGLGFENLVLNNRQLIKTALNIKYGDVVNDNPYYQKTTKKIPGCQIDYMIQTRFNTLYVCEVKFSKKPLGSRVIAQNKERLKNLVVPKQFSVRPVLIHVNGVSDDIADAHYFDEIIDFGKLLS